MAAGHPSWTDPVANWWPAAVVVVVDESCERGGESTMTRSTVSTSIKRIRRLSTAVVGASFVLAGVVSAAPADPDPVPPATGFPEHPPPFIRGWRFMEYVTDEQAETEVDAGSVGPSAPLDEQYVFGPQTVTNEGPAIGKVQSGPNMTSFRVLTSVPDDGLGNRAEFVSYEAFTKTETLAAYRYRPDHALLAVVDRNGSELLEQECDEPTMTDCSDPIQAEVTFDVAVYTADQVLFRSAGGAMLTGWHGNWTAAAWSEAYATTRLWGRSNFQHPHVDDSAALVMSRPAEVLVELSALPVGTALTARVVASASVYDRRINQEFPMSTALAELGERPPSDEAERSFTGLTLEGEPVLRIPAATPLPLCDTAPDPARRRAAVQRRHVPHLRSSGRRAAGPRDP